MYEKGYGNINGVPIDQTRSKAMAQIQVVIQKSRQL